MFTYQSLPSFEGTPSTQIKESLALATMLDKHLNLMKE